MNFSDQLLFLDSEREIFALCEIVIIVGGDGTILHCASFVKDYSVLLLPVNNGKKGVLSTLEVKNLYKLNDLFNGNYYIDEKILLECSCNENNNLFFSMNEFVVTRNNMSKCVNYKLFRFDEELCSFRSDGVIVSTPSGSSAYNLSCGGPLIHKSSNSIVVTPMASMDFHVRPVVLGDSDIVKIAYNLRENSEVLLICDGLFKYKSNSQNGYLTIKKSKKIVKFINFLD